MGDTGWIRRGARRARTGRALAVGGAVAALAAGAVACRPVDGRLDTVTVAATTDAQATRELDRIHADVAWLSCVATYSGASTASSRPSSRTAPGEVNVDCHGRTRNGKDITVKGRVHGVVSGKCVRGTLTARVDKKVRFRLQVLGNCAATPTTTYTPDGPTPHESGHRSPAAPAHHTPRPGATQTVTRTVTVHAPEPNCSCFQGK
ncbi:hypothetical protein [Streptomyces sp. NPDC006552]|uniref:hypothetical protein n=1 Tax=Streptomyces sp. NPDC006552 TaxID=3157179 RepID=UPI0033A98B6F